MATEELTSDRDLEPPVPASAGALPGAALEPDRDSLPEVGKPRSDAVDEAKTASSSTPPSDDPLIGAVIAERYKLIERVGEGGMGAVYRGEHVSLRKRVAVKFLHAELSRISEVVARFEREAIAAANLEHPNVVAAHDFGKTRDGQFFLVMEFVEGGSLRDLLEKEGRLQPARATHIVRHIASALQRAHGIGIVHRDLKPENVVLVEREGDADFAKVIDFGIAKVAAGRLADGGQALTQAGMVFGTPDYMAPEQALGGKVDHRADLYAFGVMTFEMLTGQRPFEGDDVMALLGKHMTQPPPAASTVAPAGSLTVAVDQVLAKALAKSPGERFESAMDFVHALEAALGLPVTSSGATYPPGLLAPVPASIGTPPFGTAVPAPSTITGTNAAIASPTISSIQPASNSAAVPAAAVARETLEHLVSGYHELRKDPTRHRRAVIGVAGIGLLVLVFAVATRPKSHPTTNAAVAHPTPEVPRTIATNSARVTEPNVATPTPVNRETPPPRVATPTNTANAANTTAPTASPSANDGPGLPPALAAQLAEYVSRPNVRILLDAARGRQRRAVINAFEQTRAQVPEDAIVNYLLGTLYSRERGRAAAAVERYADAVRIAPGFARDPTLLRDVVSAFAGQRRPVAQAATLITGPLAPSVGSQLLDSFMDSRSPATRARLLTLLAAPPFNAYSDATVRGLIELSAARTCEQRLPVVRQLGQDGDARALPYLRRIQVSANGCGMFGLGACNPCLTDAMPEAIAAIQHRER